MPRKRNRVNHTDTSSVMIIGQFASFSEPPRKLVYTWCVEHDSRNAELVTVEFKQRDAETEVIVTHERIPDARVREQHEAGWRGCLDGLVKHATSTTKSAVSSKA